MKKVSFISVALVLFFSCHLFGQNEKYVTAMTDNFKKLSENFNDNLLPVTAQFERIADAEKSEWLPYYYAAYYTALQTFVKSDKTNNDQLLDKAQAMLDKAFSLKPDSSECYVVQGFILVGRIMVDPMSRGAEYSQQANGAFQKSIDLNPANPRGYYLKGSTVLNTPEFYGGGKNAAKPILTQAIFKYEAFKPASPLHPNWGKEQCQAQLNACN